MYFNCYYFALLSFLAGLLGGAQSVGEIYTTDFPRALRTLPGIAYLFARGTLPALVFALLCASGTVPNSHLWLRALATGTGVEIFLRSAIYIRRSRQPDGRLEELLRGPYALLRWYESLFFERIHERFALDRMRFVQQNLPRAMDFVELYGHVIENLNGFPFDRQGRILQQIQNLRMDFEREQRRSSKQNPEFDKMYRIKLAYVLIHTVGERGFQTLVSTVA